MEDEKDVGRRRQIDARIALIVALRRDQLARHTVARFQARYARAAALTVRKCRGA